MVDITSKSETLRTAVAQAVVIMKPQSIRLIKNNLVPKGNVLEIARAATYMGVKKTASALPMCHPLPVEWVDVDYHFSTTQIVIRVMVKTIYKTGCEMEALYGASCCALCIYDMLKPVDKSIEINSIKLIEKKGGKSDFILSRSASLSAAILVISDTVSSGKNKDTSGKLIKDFLVKYKVKIKHFVIVPDNTAKIQSHVKQFSKENISLILTTGGTGLSPRDLTPEALSPMVDREIPGIMEAARLYGIKRTPYAMLSRGIAGIIHKSLLITFPGSRSGVSDSLNALFPFVFHLFHVIQGKRHE